MSYLSVNVDLTDIAGELAEQPDKLAYLLNDIADRCDGTPDDASITELLENLDNATKGMIEIIAAAIRAEKEAA